MRYEEPVTNTEKNTAEVEEQSVCRLWDMVGNNIKPAPVQVQFLEIESLPVVYIILNILVESLP